VLYNTRPCKISSFAKVTFFLNKNVA